MLPQRIRSVADFSSKFSDKIKMTSAQQSAEKQMEDSEKIDAAGMKNTRAQSSDVALLQIYNETLGLEVEILKHNVWFGSIIGTFPKTIGKGSIGSIASRGDPPGNETGSKVAVIYTGSNIVDGPHNCAWLLAWHVPADATSPNKVYVESGAINKYLDEMKWDEIEANLEASSNESSYKDDDSRSAASAQIETPDITRATAVFDVIPTPNT